MTAGTTVLRSLDVIVVEDWPGMFASGIAATSTSGSLGRTSTTPGVAPT